MPAELRDRPAESLLAVDQEHLTPGPRRSARGRLAAAGTVR